MARAPLSAPAPPAAAPASCSFAPARRRLPPLALLLLLSLLFSACCRASSEPPPPVPPSPLLHCLAAATDDDGAESGCLTPEVLADLDKDAGSRAVDLLLSRGHFGATQRLLALAKELAVDLSTALHQRSSAIRARLQLLADSLNPSAAKGIPPSFEWAQSPDSIFLNVKFAHKLDTPATLGCELVDESSAFQRRAVVLKADCREKRKAFLLSLQLFRDIAPEHCSVSLTSVGRASVTLKKSINASWPRLLFGKTKPGNLHVWWAMKEKFDAELDAFEKLQRDLEKNATAAAAALAKPAGTPVTPADGDGGSAGATGGADAAAQQAANLEAAGAAEPATGDAVVAEAAASSEMEAAGSVAAPAAASAAPVAAMESAQTRAQRSLEAKRVKATYVLEKEEQDKVKAAEDTCRRYKRGVDEASAGQKADADKRLEEARSQAAAAKKEALALLEARLAAELEAERGRLLLEDFLNANPPAEAGTRDVAQEGAVAAAESVPEAAVRAAAVAVTADGGAAAELVATEGAVGAAAV